MGSDILHCRLFRRPFDARHGWTRAGRLSVRIERGGVTGLLTEVGWRAEDGAETSLTLPELVGSYRSPDGEIWELRGEPAPEKVGELADPAVYRVFEGDTEQPLAQHPQNPLRLLLDTGEGHPVRLSWRSVGGEGGHVVFAPPFEDRNTAKVADIQATAEHSEAGEVAGNLLDGSLSTKWFAPVPRADLVLRLTTNRTVVRYELDSADDAPDRDPGDWELLGFHNGRWIVLDERHGERFGGRRTSRTFTVARPHTCDRYWLRILGNAGSPHLQLSGLRFIAGEKPEPPPTFLGWYQRPGETAVTLHGFLVRQETATTPVPPRPAEGAAGAAPAAPPRWQDWITGYSEQWFRTASEEDLEVAGPPPTGLGRPPAGIRAIERAEARLGQRLPPSLRSFYQVTDGLLEAGAFGGRVWSLAELDWMRETNADLLDLWGMFVADSGPQARALQIGANDDGDYWFLDPADVRDDEWAAYTWHPAHGADAVRHDSFAAMLADQRTTLERIRARRGRPAHPEGAGIFLAEGRRLALAGDVAAAHETLNRAMDAGSAVAAYLDAQVRLFAFPGDWYEATLRDGVLDNDHVMAAIDDDHLRGDLVPMYLALTRPDQVRPSAAWARWLTSFVPRLAARPGRPAGDDEQDDRAWDAFAATLAGDPVPDPGPFGHACAAARELVEFGRPDDAWTELRNALPSWQPDSPLRVMPTVLITDPALRTIMTPERRLIAAITRRSR
ncbi:SMI1/KNR4 family protein [Nocardia carnea]|uniref:SMI1/KNR4 family protein n=1 Tax=Nocardia carnea TaxID=37328 RepID=UPI002456D029|nr:SMI1/KNR4 family protein [Nocardia carnea]